ncbi:sulfotransferase family 2 domain-containing protein [uncultured Roseibium sp.]|uniref:sulfotransferase family 2 domain-containing protein n=1 Tax=uncultured Roseibium sp. TaxID=1936171 RepID=UPI003216D139
MRYSEQHQLMFVHIPKCAGTNIYQGLDGIADFPYALFARDLNKTVEETEALLSWRGFEHDVLGSIHQAHIPLKYLSEYFPSTYAAFAGATSFAILRNPRDRFISAIMQRLREFCDLGPTSIQENHVIEEGKNVCNWLDGKEVFCDLPYIHFTRQADYIDLEGERKVTKLFRLDQMDAWRSWMQDEFGISLGDMSYTHASLKPKGWFKQLNKVASPAYKMLPQSVRKIVKPILAESPLFVKAASQYDKMHLGDDVEKFIGDFYAKDWALFDSQAVSDAKPASAAP